MGADKFLDARRVASFPATAPAPRPHPQAPRSHPLLQHYAPSPAARAHTPPPPFLHELEGSEWEANPAMLTAMLRLLEGRAGERARARAAMEAEEVREEVLAARLRDMLSERQR